MTNERAGDDADTFRHVALREANASDLAFYAAVASRTGLEPV